MTILDEELQRLNEKILRMGCLVEEAIRNSIQCLGQEGDQRRTPDRCP
jgi:hypothetical protein